MKNFAALINALDQTNKTNDKIALLENYFRLATDEDKIWALALFAGRSIKRPVNSTLLKLWAVELAQIPFWLFDESYQTVGDLAETIALILPKSDKATEKTLYYWISYLLELGKKTEEEKKQSLQHAWTELSGNERYVFNKFLTGNFRIGVSQKLVIKALSRVTDIEEATLAHRLMGNWTAQSITFPELVTEGDSGEVSKPYPFCLAYPVEAELDTLGEAKQWQAEWKWDGIRGQLIKRNGEIFVWSRGEELLTDRFPEFAIFKDLLPDGTVIDGEILPYKDNAVLDFNILQTRITRKKLSAKNLEEAPVVFFAYDLLEWKGEDIRTKTMAERRMLLDELLAGTIKETDIMQASPVVAFSTWDELAKLREGSREMKSEGFMLKKLSSLYEVGRKKGHWWKWKIDPYSIDAVLIYAQKGHGRRADLYSDYTFAVWDNGILVPFAKAYSGLTDAEMRSVDAFIKRNTVEKFGPVRSVTPKLVFEIGFEGINRSTRHKSGIALRFPRMLRFRTDKKPEDANTLEDLIKLL